jgi:hypothetical protein
MSDSGTEHNNKYLITEQTNQKVKRMDDTSLEVYTFAMTYSIC